jgi:hypothetical protein
MTLERAIVAVAASFGLLSLSAAPLRAQGLALDGQVGYFSLSSASKSANAVFGSAGGATYGGSLTYAFGSGFYLEGGARYFSKTGQRVFLAGPSGPVFPLGFPLKMRLVPIFFNVGYRFGGRGPIVPYLAVGGSVTSFHEESTVAGLTTAEDSSKGGGQVLAGLEFGKGHLRLAGEAGYAFVPNTVGIAGVSKVYGEKDLGGFSVVGKLILGFSSRK